MSSLPRQVGVYGGGRMGAGIAHAFLVSGSEVVIVEVSREAAAIAEKRVEDGLRRAEERGLIDDLGGVAARLGVTDSAHTLHDCALVIEAVPEHPDLKAQVLATIQTQAPDAWVASNTSSLSIDRLAGQLSMPENLIGLHFFNPVPASELVEIVVGTKTSPQLVEAAQTWVPGLGKTGVTVRDSPGFASSRLGVVIALEAMRMLEEGVATAEDIDTAMTLGYKHPTGPLRTSDIVGLDIRLAIAEHLAGEIGPRFEPPEILREHVDAGRLGRKTGSGFYSW